MIKFNKKGTSLVYTRCDEMDFFDEKFMFTKGEELIGKYEHGKNVLLITNKKFLFILKTANKKDTTIIPYSKMQLCSVAKGAMHATVDFYVSYMQRVIVTLKYGANEADYIAQAYSYQNTVDSVITKDPSVFPVAKPVKPVKEVAIVEEEVSTQEENAISE